MKKWPSKGLILECKNCKEKIQDFLRTSYCTCQVISLKSDFFIQKEVIEELIEKADYKYIFYPKFYCELNFIERYWRAYKRYIGENCNYSWNGLQQVIPKSLDFILLVIIRKFARKCGYYMDAYKKGISRKLVEYAVKKYKSHRRIPDSVLEELNKIKIN